MMQRMMLSLFALALGLGCSGSHPGGGTPAPRSSAAAGSASAKAAASAKPPGAPSSPSPIDGALPDSAPPALVDRVDCGLGMTCTMAHLVPDELVRGLSARGALAVWEETIAGDAEVIFPADTGIELVGVVLDGGAAVVPQEKDLVEKPMGQRWMGFRAPGAGVSLVPLKGRRARLVLAIAVVQADTSLAKHVEQWDKDKASLTWTERQKRIDIIDFNTKDDLAWGKGAYHARIGWEASKYRYGTLAGKGPKQWDVDDQPALVMSLLRFSKDAGVAEHFHEKERECMAILEGAGQLLLKTGGGPEQKAIDIEPGSTACIPAGMRHTWKPTGTSPFFAVQVYSPRGPEQRFKKLSGKAP
jgi:mannose-6-phosphate isomerase-like protein (cupin superfamily)